MLWFPFFSSPSRITLSSSRPFVYRTGTMRQSLLLLALICRGLCRFGHGQEPNYDEIPISESPAQRLNAQGIAMALSNVQPLNGASVLMWAEVTGNHLATEITEIIGSDLVDAVAVSVSLVAQDPPFLEPQEFPAPVPEPNTQTIQEVLTLDVTMFIRSVVTEHDVNRYIMGAFNSDVERVLYLAMLKATGDVAFVDASNVTVTPPTFISPVDTANSNGRVDTPNSHGHADTFSNHGGSSGLSTTLIVAVALLCFSAIALAAFILYARNAPAASLGDTRNKSVWEKETGTWAEAISPRSPTSVWEKETGTWAEAISQRKNAYPTNDVEEESLYMHGVKTQSTFIEECLEGDCSYASPCARTTTTTTEMDVNAAHHRNAPASVGDDSQQSEFTPHSGFVPSVTYESYLTSDAKKLTKFQVNAPPGDLGLLLGTCEDGIVIVEEITRFSPLIGQVRVGDRLFALDGRDTTTMLATTVSGLIVSKEYNQVRRLIFARPEEHIP